MPELDRKAATVFAGKVVRKDLVRKVKVGANVPVFVLEYLLGKYCATDDLAAIDAGATDYAVEEDVAEIYTEPGELHKVAEALTATGLEVENAELVMKPQTMLQPEPDQAVKAIRLLEKLEDLDDVQNVYSNLDISDEVLAEVS